MYLNRLFEIETSIIVQYVSQTTHITVLYTYIKIDHFQVHERLRDDFIFHILLLEYHYYSLFVRHLKSHDFQTTNHGLLEWYAHSTMLFYFILCICDMILPIQQQRRMIGKIKKMIGIPRVKIRSSVHPTYRNIKFQDFLLPLCGSDVVLSYLFLLAK